MAKVIFTSNLQRYLDCPIKDVPASTVAEALDATFSGNQLLASYIMDDQRHLRKNIAVFVDGMMISDRRSLSDPLQPGSEVYVLQALSGG